ncbi:malonic semialdehyde reductase [Xanthomonas sp. WHRI 8391]|uniref:Putative NADH dehydrogenase/NAD(P)H nitroreductase CFBP7900_06880 n=1 Tax=Xanthomonas hortorum pv. carotae TaxID=487904 RepID=A0A6V7C3J0_9XANT|nr:malonic semialdehyde reductase [Xanthomonas hortorum]ETC89644.1 nitroreductase [Xanthomonas hortorum pv. carotae str. M081]MBG3850039.1 malonic semialdehyde reductase [Xanthomonas hortorum pv. carotae]UTS73759.1 malonic semialdehyde reductase [Xanthomonas hortorum]CAD0309292.1 putative malonic semialdehyde reductase RutE [Xanthomonas hortorum pv. carotae]CAD0309300.1 putative malonic semialdehyde reductase RutE [Xanthomonas hortorum pv. carotae]
MSDLLDAAVLDQLFRTARTQNAFLDTPVSEDQLRQLYELVKWGPTAANGSPARFVFVTSPEGKQKLKPALSEANAAKTLGAPVTVIVGYDEQFHEKLPYLFPHADAKSWFEGSRDMRVSGAFRNSSLQGAYLILAARALGLDAGPMSGFDNAKVDAAFFAGTPIKSNFLINLGYGDPAALYPRLPRLSFDEAARIE